MPIFANVNLGVPAPLGLEEYKPTVGEYASAQFDAAFDINPTQVLARQQKMTGWEDGLDLSDAGSALDPTVDLDFEQIPYEQAAHALPLEEQTRQIKEAGLEGQIKPDKGYRQEALDIIIENKRLENALGFMGEKAGLGTKAVGLGASFAAGFLDPINLASSLVPVVGEQRMLSMLGAANGALGRAGVRAGVGAASGAVGSLLVEPMIYTGQQELQADYDFTNSLMNVAFGAAMGGALHTGGGAFADWRRNRTGKPHPWELAPEDDNTRALMQAHAEDMAHYLREANPNIDPDLAMKSALADAALFDSHARNWAYHEKKPVSEYYAQNRPEYRSWRDGETQAGDWRSALPPDWSARNLDPADPLHELGWLDGLSLRQFLDSLDDLQIRFPDLADYGGIKTKIRDTLNISGWHEALPPDWPQLNSQPGNPVHELGWLDGMDIQHFLDRLDEIETRFPDFADYAEIRDKLAAMRSLGIENGPVEAASPTAQPVNPITLYQSSPVVIGNKTQILGPSSREVARYEVREMDGILSSHDPENQFHRRPGYPEQAQERPYHSDQGEQQKVIGNSLNYEPAFVLSTDATAGNGPPIITQNGIVLGGNSRAMTLQLVYGSQPEKAAAYRQMLKDNAAQFGIDPNAMAGMKRPMLVRVVSGKFTPEELAKRSREYNQTTTQSLQGAAEGISRARFVDRASLDILIAGLKEGRTIGEFLASPESADLALALQNAGVLQQSEISSLTTPGSGRLNDAGKARVMQIMRGLVLPDYDVLSSLPRGVLDNLDAGMPTLALTRLRGGGWDLTGAFYDAMRFVARAHANGEPVENQFFQHALVGADPHAENPVVQALAITFANADAREVRLRMGQYLSLADIGAAGQNSLVPGMDVTPAQAFRKAFLEPLVYVGEKRIVKYRPDANPRDAAIQWASEHVGKNPTVEKALAKLEKELTKKKLPPETRATLLNYQKQLGKMEGSIGIRQPKLPSFWQDPAKLEIPRPKQPGEKGALPESTVAPDPPLTDPDALLPPELRSEPDEPETYHTPRGMVQFDPRTNRAVVTFFQSADLSTAPHELFHIFRREMERTAMAADASAHAREQWSRLQEFVGAEEGKPWTEAMEEKFANAGLRYLAEGRAPTTGLQGVFDSLKEWFMDIYGKAEHIGVEISPAMRKAFDEMFTVPYDTADRQFRYAMGDIHSRRPEETFTNPDTTGGRFSPEDQALLDRESQGDLETVESLLAEDQARVEEMADNLARRDPEYAGAVIDEEFRAQLDADEAAIRHVDEREELLRQSLECQMNGAA